MVKETLRSLGLTNNEVEIYITLLAEGESSVNEIATKSGLHRQVCYDALDRLLEKGFVSYVIKKQKKFFKALEPESIVNYLEEKKSQVNSILPQLKSMIKAEKEETGVEVIKGKAVLRTIYNDIIKNLQKTKDVLYVMGIEETKFLEFDRIAIKQHIARMKELKLKEKLLAREGAKVFFEGPQSEYRLLPEKLFNPNPTHIYSNKVAIIIWGSPVHGIIINSKQVADANRKYFEILWKTAKKK